MTDGTHDDHTNAGHELGFDTTPDAGAIEETGEFAGDYADLEDCVADRTHLTSCDDDGYCNFCGQEALECVNCREPIAEPAEPNESPTGWAHLDGVAPCNPDLTLGNVHTYAQPESSVVEHVANVRGYFETASDAAPAT